jgi:hypothetical protein
MRQAMNYKTFMNAVDEKLSMMSEVEKTEWIHNIARTTNEDQRIIFVNSLTNKQVPSLDTSAKKKVKDLEDWCRKIEDAEIYFECSGHEVYGESYWNRDYSYEYFDNFDIGEDLSRAFQVAEGLLFQKEYEQAAALYELLCTVPFSALDIDMEDWSELGLEDLVENKLAILNLKQIALNLMYAKYQASEGEARAAALYRYLSWYMCKNIKMDEMFTVGPEELKGIDIFMEEWITFLKNTDGDRAGNFLAEACIYQGGTERLSQTAKETAEKHPISYKYACEHLLNEKKFLECEEMGLEAIHKIPEDLIIRGEVADLTAEAARQLEHADILEECYKIAFYSDSTLNHYLRLFELPDYPNITNRAEKHASALPVALPERTSWEVHDNIKHKRVNYLSHEQKNVIRFFNREFDELHDICKKDKTRLGWSSHIKGIAVPLFILLLDHNNKITKVGQQLIDGMKYRLRFVEDDTTSFTECFLNWKEKVVLTKEQYEKYIAWLKDEVDKRTEAVVGEGHRNSYHKAAALIAALGETLESNGELHGKRSLIERYKKTHSRKRAFKAEFEILNEI